MDKLLYKKIKEQIWIKEYFDYCINHSLCPKCGIGELIHSWPEGWLVPNMKCNKCNWKRYTNKGKPNPF